MSRDSVYLCAMTKIYQFLNSWRADLKGLGFIPRSTGGRRGLYLDRSIGFATQTVGVLINESRGGAVNVQLTVDMPLPLAEPQHNVVILSGDVGRDRVTIIEPWVHDPGLITWWPPHEHNKAWAALSDRGLLWFRRFATGDALIKYFEAAFARHESSHTSQPSWFDRIMRRSAREVAPAHHQYLLFLAMLYEIDGNNALAFERIAAYAEEMKRRGIKSELSRLERHMSEIRARVNRNT